MQQVLAENVKLIVTDSRLAFMQGRYEESLPPCQAGACNKNRSSGYLVLKGEQK